MRLIRATKKLLRKPTPTIMPDSLEDNPRVAGEFGLLLWFILYTRRITVTEIEFPKSKSPLAPECGFRFSGTWDWTVVKYKNGIVMVKYPQREIPLSTARECVDHIFQNDAAVLIAVNSWWLEGMDQVFLKARRNFFDALEYANKTK